jgi:hypothetical protein
VLVLTNLRTRHFLPGMGRNAQRAFSTTSCRASMNFTRRPLVANRAHLLEPLPADDSGQQRAEERWRRPLPSVGVPTGGFALGLGGPVDSAWRAGNGGRLSGAGRRGWPFFGVRWYEGMGLRALGVRVAVPAGPATNRSIFHQQTT